MPNGTDLNMQVNASPTGTIQFQVQNSAAGGSNAEAWAVGKRNGVDVPSTDPTYHNNAEWYAQQANPYTMIDDTAGNGDINKVWSADKVYDELAKKVNNSEKGTANGVAELDANGKVPSSQLPSYVDDVLEYANLTSFPSTGESGKLYLAIDTKKLYRWTGSTYAVISDTLTLGTTSSTAYRGDRGDAAYKAAVTNPDAVPTANSTHLVKSGGVVSYIAEMIATTAETQAIITDYAAGA